MALTVVPTAYGRAASRALHEVVTRAKNGDPLAPVTVLVPTNSVGVTARRFLALGELGRLTPVGAGVAGVTFLTVLRLAELLAAPALAAAGRRPVSTPVVASAVRHVLADAPGLFATVAVHPATEESLVAAHRELADLDDAHLDVLRAQHSRARDVVRIHRATRALLEPRWYDEHDLMRVATASIDQDAALLVDFGTIVCFLPQRWSEPAARLLRALAATREVVLIAGLTGVGAADAAVTASVARLGVKLEETTPVAPTLGTAVFTASDPDDEVRTIVRGVVEAMRAGAPLERMAILFGAADPYARLVHEHLDLAGIPHNGATVRTLADCVLGRTLLRLLAVPDASYRRDEVCALFATAPLLDGNGQRVPGVAWERIARKAGVVGGIDEWTVRLESYRAQQHDNPSELRRAQELRVFVETLARDLAKGQRAHTWAMQSEWAHDLVDRYIGREASRERWPQFEQDAARRVEAVLDRLAGLDAIDPAASTAVFRRTLELELRTARARVGHLGEGVLVGSPALALGVELERMWVCGLAEGVFPAAPHDDPLLGDRERAALGGELALRADRVDDDHRALLAALASTMGDRVLSMPRGDLRRSTEHVPSRFLLDTMTALGPDAVRTQASYAHGIARVAFPASRHELAVRAALSADSWVRAMPEVARSRELITARADSCFTRFDGNLASVGDELQRLRVTTAERAISPTRLEQWVACPHAYFVRHVLHVDPVDRPEDVLQLSPLDRGSLVHEVLDRFFRPSAAGAPTSDGRARLRELAGAACIEAEARGLTGRRLLWDRDRRVLLAELDAFFTADEVYRSERHTHTLATEIAFGANGDDVPVVDFALSDGRRLRLRGKIDRVDRVDDGRLVVVDYKTGRPDAYLGLSAEDPIAGGERLQLPVYAYAARAAYGAAAPVEAGYWFVGRGNDRWIGYEVDAGVDTAFDAAVRAIIDGIESGCFVATPPPPSPRPFIACRYCDPDGLGTADRWREWERKYDAPELAPLRTLLERNEEHP